MASFVGAPQRLEKPTTITSLTFPVSLHQGINVHHYIAELEKNQSSEVEDCTLKSIFGIYGMPVTIAAMCQLKSC